MKLKMYVFVVFLLAMTAGAGGYFCRNALRMAPPSPVSTTSAPQVPVVKVDDYQPQPIGVDYRPPVTTDTQVGMVVNRRRSLDQRLAPILEQQLVAVDVETDREALHRVLLDPDDDDTIRHEVTNLLRRIEDPKVEGLLNAVLDDRRNQERFRFFATQHLGEIYKEFVEKKKAVDADRLRTRLHVLLSSDPHAYVRRQALLSLAQTKDQPALDVARRILRQERDEHPLMDVACRIAGECRLEDSFDSLRSKAKSSVQVVRLRALGELGSLRDEASRGAFLDASQSTDRQIKAAGQAALRSLDAASTAGSDPKAAP